MQVCIGNFLDDQQNILFGKVDFESPNRRVKISGVYIYIYIETAYFNQDSQKTHWWWLMKACSRHIPTVNIPFFHTSAQPPSAGEAHEG